MRSSMPIILMPLIWPRADEVVETRFYTLEFHNALAGLTP